MRGRPAETTGAVGAIGLLVASLAGVDDATSLTAIGVVLGLVPAAVTLLVANGGVRGVLGLLWRGRDRGPAVVESKNRRT